MPIITQVQSPNEPELIYPESDGQPMSDNTKQFRWIVTIKEGLEWLFQNDPNVFVAGDLLWYPTEGNNVTRAAPDAMVAFVDLKATEALINSGKKVVLRHKLYLRCDRQEHTDRNG